MKGYYDRPIVKPPSWKDFIPAYFFAGGLAGTAATLAFAARLTKRNELAGVMLFGSAGGTIVSTFCLIADLKKPERFLNMLRVFKPTSPMSVGVYLLSAFGGATMLAAGSAITGIARPLGSIAEGLAGLLGPMMSVYTAVLIGDTVVPAWHYAHRSMPFLFGSTSAATAGGWGLLLCSRNENAPARTLAIGGGLCMLASLQLLHQELGPTQSQAYRKEYAGELSRAARLLTVAGTACAVLCSSSRGLARVAGALMLAGGLAERFAVYRAGCASAKDPAYLLDGQRSQNAIS